MANLRRLTILAALAAALSGAGHIFVVGSGGAHPAALEAALKLKEMAIVHAEGTESWEMASGVATIVDAESVVISLAPDGQSVAVDKTDEG
jgi:glucosamine--fructose-6-phosphate aminotransferase (isomerizing)